MLEKIKAFLKPAIDWLKKQISKKGNIYFFPLGVFVLLLAFKWENPLYWLVTIWWVITVVHNYPRHFEDEETGNDLPVS